MKHPRYVVLEKPIGQTPLEAIGVWKQKHPQLASLPATYAGRLDPMASGKLLVLLGTECAKREQYLGMDKEYVVEVVFGASTDTGDSLGLAEVHERPKDGHMPSRSTVTKALSTLTGTHRVPYPAFSSKTVTGIPLFQYALEGKLRTISIPEHDETIYKMSIFSLETISAKTFLERLQATLALVPRSDEPSKVLGADFRQDTIRARWNEVLKDSNQSFTLVKLRVTCASGTYMRTLARRLGNALGTQGFALSIHRSKIGRHKKIGPFGFWIQNY